MKYNQCNMSINRINDHFTWSFQKMQKKNWKNLISQCKKLSINKEEKETSWPDKGHLVKFHS